MPSSKSPSALQVGPGRLPANVVTSSALTSISGTTASASTPPISVVSVSTGTALSRVGQHMVVIVDNTSGAFTISLPLESQLGDIITFVIKTTSLNPVTIQRSGGNTIQGFSTSETLSGPYEARTFVRSTSTDWTTSADKPSVQAVAASTTLLRAGPSLLVLADATSGTLVLTLPQRAQVGDHITVIKSTVTNNSVRLDGNGSDTIDGRLTTTISAFQQSITIVRVAAGAWVTLSETSSVIEITDTFTLASIESAKEIYVLVRTSDAAWIAGTKTVTLPSSSQTRQGATITIADVDGNAESANISIASQVLGTSPSGTSGYTLTHGFASVKLLNKATGNWTIVNEDLGLVPNFFALARADNRSDVAQSRLSTLPQFNWSHRRVAVHAEFTGPVTNILPVEGFSPGGNIILSSVAGVTGTVGVLRCSVVTGSSGYLHLGSTPTSALFSATQIMGFRVILRLNTANPGTAYDFAIGFGDDISDVTGNIGSGTDNLMGANGLWIGTNGASTQWRRVRRSSNTASGADFGAITAGNRYVIEYYFDGTNWDSYTNGVRSIGGSTNIPSTFLNFGLQLIDTTSVTPTVDIDSITIFTSDLGATRFT